MFGKKMIGSTISTFVLLIAMLYVAVQDLLAGPKDSLFLVFAAGLLLISIGAVVSWWKELTRTNKTKGTLL